MDALTLQTIAELEQAKIDMPQHADAMDAHITQLKAQPLDGGPNAQAICIANHQGEAGACIGGIWYPGE